MSDKYDEQAAELLPSSIGPLEDEAGCRYFVSTHVEPLRPAVAARLRADWAEIERLKAQLAEGCKFCGAGNYPGER